MIQRRGLIAGLGALLAAPAIIRTPGLLMPVTPPLQLWGVSAQWEGEAASGAFMISGVWARSAGQALRDAREKHAPWPHRLNSANVWLRDA